MKRLVYDFLLSWKNSTDRKPLILQGARQVGKTWILKHFGQNEFRELHYVNLENTATFETLFRDTLQPHKILTQLSILLNTEINYDKDLVVFDEIQNVASAVTSLKYFREELPQLAVCGAGSYIGLTVHQGSFPVGKVSFLDLYPMTFEEFLMATDQRASEFIANIQQDTTSIPEAIHRHLWESLKTYFVTGGMPEAVDVYRRKSSDMRHAFDKVREVQKNLIKGYRSDFAKHAGKVNAVHINSVFEIIPARLAQATDVSVSRFRFKGVIPNRSKFAQLQGPIDWLVRAGLVLKVCIVEKPQFPLAAYAKNNIFKLYIFDVGLLGCLLDLPVPAVLNQDYGSYKGFFAENFVAQEFTSTDKSPLYFWQGHNSEIEFLKCTDDSIVPIEVKAGSATRSKSLMAFAQKYNPPLKIKVTARNLDRTNPDTHNYPLYLASKIKASFASPTHPAHQNT